LRLIIAGPRDFHAATVDSAVAAGVEAFLARFGLCLEDIMEVVSGRCPDRPPGRSVDLAGQRWALAHDRPVAGFAAQWRTLGARAGPERNGRMARYAAASPFGRGGLLAVRDHRATPGTSNMVRQALAADLLVHEHRVVQP